MILNWLNLKLADFKKKSFKKKIINQSDQGTKWTLNGNQKSLKHGYYQIAMY